MKNALFLFLLSSSIQAASQSDEALVKFINPSTVSKPTGYSHAAEVDLGTCTMLVISGQVALDAQGNLVGKDDFEKQTEQVFQNLKSIVENSGGTMKDIVKFGIYVLDASKTPQLREIRNKYIDLKNPPASTLVEVKRLVREEWLVEIEATAIIRKR